MSNIAIIRDRSLYMSGIVNELNSKIKDHRFYSYQLADLAERKEKISNHIDVWIMEMNTSNVMKEIKSLKKLGHLVAVWNFSGITRDHLHQLMEIGIDGYFYGDLEIHEFTSAVKDMLHGFKYIHSYYSTVLLNEYARITNQIGSKRPDGLLTVREWEILENISKGLQNEEIAKHLGISDKTVKNHVSSILNKLNVKDRTSAVITAIKNNWVRI